VEGAHRKAEPLWRSPGLQERLQADGQLATHDACPPAAGPVPRWSTRSGGPDFVNAFALFPDYKGPTCSSSLEPPGEIPALAGMDEHQLGVLFFGPARRP